MHEPSQPVSYRSGNHVDSPRKPDKRVWNTVVGRLLQWRVFQI